MENKHARKREKLVIGRKDKLDLPALALFDIDAKIDTGAYTGAIHCHNIELIPHPEGEKVKFNLLDPSHEDYNEQQFILPVHRKKRVKSSSGNVENRVFIQTEIKILGSTYMAELSLTDRSDMRYPVLIGRKLLKKRFLVDVDRINVSYRKKKKNASRKENIGV